MTLSSSSGSATLVETLAGARRFFVTHPCRRGPVRHRSDVRGGTNQRPSPLHAGAVHVSADGRLARRPRAGFAAGSGEPGALSAGGHRRASGVCRVRDASARGAAASGPDRRLSDVVSNRGVRDRISRRARLRSPLFHIGPRHAGRPGGRLRMRRDMARRLRAMGTAPSVCRPRSPPACIRSSRPTW